VIQSRWIDRGVTYNSTADDEPDEHRGKRVSAFRHFSMGRSTRLSKTRSAARMTCDCLSPIRSVSRRKILRSASVSRIVVFSKNDRCRMTQSDAIEMPNCVAKVWRRRNLA
jgi:hypothetical protein